MEYYSALKRKEILLFVATWMEVEGVMLSEISQSQKDNLHDSTYITKLVKCIEAENNSGCQGLWTEGITELFNRYKVSVMLGK